MDKDTAHYSNETAGKPPSPAQRAQNDAKLRAILDDLNRPLDEVDWAHTTLRGKKLSSAVVIVSAA